MTSVSLSVCIHRAGQLMKARILIADDHPQLPEIEARLLGSDFEVVGKVSNGRALVDEALRLKPDVIVTDISMPVLDGISAADLLKESGNKSRIVFLSVHTDTDFVRKCLSTGAFAYVVKSRIGSELVLAVRHALAGTIFVSHNSNISIARNSGS